jgi:hypothetical protein
MSAIVDRLMETASSRGLAGAQDSGCVVTARRGRLSANITTMNADLESADAQARAMAGACFNYLARRRSQNSPIGANVPAGRSDLQLMAPMVPGQR